MWSYRVNRFLVGVFVAQAQRTGMGYHHVDPADIDPAPDRPSTKRSISDACGLENLGVHRSAVAPGDEILLAYHDPDEQAELFHVIEGGST